LLADALLLRGEVVKGGLESFGFRDPRCLILEDVSSEELEEALTSLVHAPCLSKLQKLDLDGVVLGSWAAAIYLNTMPWTDNLRELRVHQPSELDDDEDDEGLVDLFMALGAGMYRTC
jgi:hypothetical protein